MAAKINPRKRPATEADVNRAFAEGVRIGVSNASALYLMVLVDKYDAADHIQDVWNDICKLREEIDEGRLTFADLRRTLLDEYLIEV